jgi:hypothetical protein
MPWHEKIARWGVPEAETGDGNETRDGNHFEELDPNSSEEDDFVGLVIVLLT